MPKTTKYKMPLETDHAGFVYQPHWVSPKAVNVDSERLKWYDNTPFFAAISFSGMTSGYSAKYFRVYNSDTGIHYNMFVADALRVLQYGEVSQGICRAYWKCIKRGQNFGIQIVEDM